MATNLVARRPGGGSSKYEVEKSVGDVVQAVNNAIQTEKKFISLKLVDGKTRGFVAADVISIQEA